MTARRRPRLRCCSAARSRSGCSRSSSLSDPLEDALRLEVVYRPLGAVLATGAAIALLAGWLAPAPWILAALLVTILTALWFFVVARMIRAGAWGEARPEAA